MSIPSFDTQVPDNGYHWWYIDAVSDDDQHALTLIIFIGSVFSPYYSRARKRGNARAAEHCSFNVALYGRPWRWSMTERTEASLRTSRHVLSIGKSVVSVEDQSLCISVDEIAVPFPTRLRGKLRIDLPSYHLQAHALDDQKAQHFWQPIAPQTRIHVDFEQPSLSWQGAAYVDSNYGSVPLESSFKSWVWSRSHAQDGSTDILYDITHKNGEDTQRSMHFSRDGAITAFTANEKKVLPATRYWRIPRQARIPRDARIDGLQTLEDTPFYSRSRFDETRDGNSQVTVHESLYLERFDTSWVRCLLPFRMPRRRRAVLLD